MVYQIEVKELTIVKNKMTLTIMGTISDPTINSHFLSNPKLVLHFNNGKEDRRIPFVLSNVTHIDGKCFFSGRYTYRLDLLFWKTRKECLPFEMFLNLGFADFYEEKIPVDLTPELSESDNRNFKYTIHGNKIEFTPDRRKIYHNPVAKFFVKFFNGIIKTVLFILSLALIPFFILEALLRMTGIMNLPARFNDENPIKRFIAYIFWRFSRVSTTDLSVWKVKRWIFRRCFGFYKTFFKVQDKKISFISLRRDDLSGNFAFVYDKLKNDDSLDINFILNDHTIAYMSFKEIRAFTKACATSKVVVLDEFTPQIHYIDLRDDTKLIQLWHACGAFKTFGFTRLSKPKGSPQPTRNHRSYDFVTVSSTYCKKCHSEGFGIATDNVVATGIPRTDVFFDENYKAAARKKFYDAHPTFKGKKIILFAPTFRGMVKETAFYPTEMFDINEVCSKIPDDYAIIIKHHPFVNDVQPIPDRYKDRVIDLSADNELNDLLFVTNVIITDYSSLVFEASLIDIPMIFYVFDLEKYINERDFYFDFKLYAPGKIVYSTEQLIDSIKNEDYCTEKIKPFADMFFDYRDGRSTQRVVKLIYDNLK
ncbi:CDP-glycerol glycerophosphotransferase family protein [Lachnoclostridium sp. MSJ-17]|uniref:CDP-glycerol glycerophosphotransferase family protein n=1 Tax=Lachnoclostridium sp. MSJ-17 TaxID=2841516 RepID=UPI001C0FCC89|nr:CDP-glycerol glycerophosphotransferase family protein [Lachnoclostridium sp. MSJ-17]